MTTTRPPASSPPTTTAADRALPCGCVPCVCGDDERCHGCGARYCARHAPSEGAPPAPEQLRVLNVECSACHSIVPLAKWEDHALRCRGPFLSEPHPPPAQLLPSPSPRAQETVTARCPIPRCHAGMLRDPNGRDEVSCPVCDGTLTAEQGRALAAYPFTASAAPSDATAQGPCPDPARDIAAQWSQQLYAEWPPMDLRTANEAARLLKRCEAALEQAIRAALAREVAAREQVERERDEALERARLSQRDRADALNVRSRDGLLSSEWLLRTGAAERERDEARASAQALATALREQAEKWEEHAATLRRRHDRAKAAGALDDTYQTAANWLTTCARELRETVAAYEGKGTRT